MSLFDQVEQGRTPCPVPWMVFNEIDEEVGSMPMRSRSVGRPGVKPLP
ncbi:MAG: hypothetical protein OJF52_003246 [Nitrospira sp.]|nr:MAG: hypothetical protein OJF52_003246 [Nitrospira sp.]